VSWHGHFTEHPLDAAQGRAVFDRWRLHSRPRLRRLPPDSVRLVRTLAPPQGRFPDFLNPREATAGFAEGIEAVLSTPCRRRRREIGLLRSAPP